MFNFLKMTQAFIFTLPTNKSNQICFTNILNNFKKKESGATLSSTFILLVKLYLSERLAEKKKNIKKR